MPQSEKEKMLAGELYRSTDCELQGVMAEAQRHLRCLNAIPNEDSKQRFAVLRVLLGEIGSGTQIKSPFACDYGVHIRMVAMDLSTMDVCFLTVTSSPLGTMLRLGRAFTSMPPSIRLIQEFDAAAWKRQSQ
jgi:maltose O-acetyltransferase